MPSLKISREQWATFAILVLAALFRLLLLGLKPPHFDEGVNGWFLDQMKRTGFYHYDPANYHGPLHFYLLFFFYSLMGRTIWALRLPVALISVASVWMMLRFDRFLPRKVCLVGALVMAVSPAMVFYGRYAIHESELLFFLLLAVWGGAGLMRFGTQTYMWAFGLGVTGMVLTKETYVIHLVCFALAAACLWLWERVSPSHPHDAAAQQWTYGEAALTAAVCIAAILFFYSGALLDASSLHGLYLTFAEWIRTGREGHGHEKEWFYWVKLLGTYEWLTLAGLVWSVRYAWPGTDRLMRFLAIYGCGALTAYSIVRYKTPWCVISLAWPFMFLAGDMARELPKRLAGWRPFGTSPEILVRGVVSVLLVASTVMAVRLNFFRHSEPREPYVYVQTFPDINRFVEPLLNVAKKNPANYHLEGEVILSSYHPLPWMLGDFTGIGYWDEDQSPSAPDADFIIIDEDRFESIAPSLHGTYFAETIRLRDSQGPARVLFAEEAFRSLFPHRAPEFTPRSREPAEAEE